MRRVKPPVLVLALLAPLVACTAAPADGTRATDATGRTGETCALEGTAVAVEPTWAAFDAWRAHFDVRTDAWRAIPWRASYREGLADAADANRPVLLWVMNGHPLGPT